MARFFLVAGKVVAARIAVPLPVVTCRDAVSAGGPSSEASIGLPQSVQTNALVVPQIVPQLSPYPSEFFIP